MPATAPEPCPETCSVLLIGGGGREHALAWKIAQSPRLGALWLTDSANAALTSLGRHCPHVWDPKNTFPLVNFCKKESIDLVIVGPEVPLAQGIADLLSQDAGCVVFGPTAAGARIESDKAWSKQLMRQASIPTAEARIFDNVNGARRYLLRGLDDDLTKDGREQEAESVARFLHPQTPEEHFNPRPLPSTIADALHRRDEPVVVKASGLAAGKGVIVCKTTAEAMEAVDQIMVEEAFGEAGREIVIEEFLHGQEVSVLALVDGRTITILDPCQDHKQVGEGDVGPNTGGMGAYCPAPVIDRDQMAIVEREVFVPAIDAMRREGIEYRGVLYAGVMLTPGGPKVLEFNCRFGDPECQPLMARLRGDLIEILWATATGQLDTIEIDFTDDVACCVVMCSEGYPGSYPKGRVIEGLDAAEQDGVHIFHAGTATDGDGHVVTNGGRVLGVTALAPTLQEARDKANGACDQISFDGGFFRRDIGDRVLSKVRQPV